MGQFIKPIVMLVLGEKYRIKERDLVHNHYLSHVVMLFCLMG